MPGLLRGVARVAVVAGTATAVSGRVQRRQARRFGDPNAQAAPPPEQPQAEAALPEQRSSAPDAEPAPDKFEQLKTLGELKAQGVLTEEEFAQEKAKLLA